MSETSTSTTGGQQKNITASDLAIMLSELNPPPKMLAMEYKFFSCLPSQWLPNNTIILSMDLAKKLGWVKT